MRRQLTDISEFPVFPDEEIMLDSESLQLFDEITVEILHNVDMRLNSRKLSTVDIRSNRPLAPPRTGERLNEGC